MASVMLSVQPTEKHSESQVNMIFVAPHIHNRKAKLRIWERTLTPLGALLKPNVDADVTHVIVEPGTSDVKSLPDQPGKRQGRASSLLVVTPEWLTDCLSAGRRLPEDKYQLKREVSEAEAQPAPGAQKDGVYWDEKQNKWRQIPAYGRWLGRWDSHLDEMDQYELMLQAEHNLNRSLEIGTDHAFRADRLSVDQFASGTAAEFSLDHCCKVGNDRVFRALGEMMKYEMALDEDRLDDPNNERINYRTLKYARAAASVQACAYKINDNLQSGQLPFVGEALTKQVQDILATGTCRQLEQFRHDEVVTDSHGDARHGTAGGYTRMKFKRLPGVGSRMARNWWNQGFRAYEDVEEACEEGGEFEGQRNNHTITHEAEFSLLHREDLLEDMPAEDVAEMRTAVMEALEAVEGPGWRLIGVGGGARGLPSHDCDFIVTHDSNMPAEGVVVKVVDELQRAGKLWRKEDGAMCRVQTGRMPGHVERMKRYVVEDANSKQASNLAQDRFDHLFGMFKTSAGKTRRIDLIFVPPEELPFGTLGWIGSRQFLRFMRAHACAGLHMHLNSHRLIAWDAETKRAWLVPDEGPPLDHEGCASWPPGWDAHRRVQHESDVFELMRLPYHPPQLRNCP